MSRNTQANTCAGSYDKTLLDWHCIHKLNSCLQLQKSENKQLKRDNCFLAWPGLAVIAVILFAGSGIAVADSSYQDPDATQLDEIVVHATRMDKRIDEVPAAISVITKDDIQLGRQQLGLDESLSAIPGLFMQDRYNFAQDLRIAIRGFGARSNFGIRGIKILVDGIPESLPDGQGQSDGIDLGSVERIEVIRGPASSLYGNASGGVINITSERGTADPFVDTRLSFGEFDFNKFQVKVGGEADRLNYLVNISHMKYDGYRDHSQTENTSLNARFVYETDNDAEYGLVFNATDQPVANDPGGVTLIQAQTDPKSARQRNVDFDAGEALDQQRIGLSYRKSFGERHEIRLRNHYVWRDFANKLPFTSGGAVQFDRFFVGGGAIYTYRGELWGRPNSLIVGTDIDRQDDARRRFDNNMGVLGSLTLDQTELVTSFGVFVQNELALSENLALTVGLRYDEVKFEVEDKFLADGDDSGDRTLSETSPMIGIVYTPSESTSLYATFSTAFETPTTTEFANPSGAGGFNPDVDPQIAKNYEVGIRGILAGRNRYELSLFTIDVEDELISFELATQPGRNFFSNAGKSTRKGVEISFVSEPVEGLRISVAYTYSDFQFDEFLDDNGNDFSGNALPGIPDDLLRGEVAYRHPSGFYGVVDVLDVGDFFVNNANSAINDSYSVVNLRAGFANFRFGDWTLSPYVGINNLTDEQYAANVRINAFGGRYFEPAPERHLYGGLAIRYNFARRQ